MSAFAKIFSEGRRDREAMIRVGAKLYEIRNKKRVTLRQLSNAVGLSAPFVCDVEHGRRRMTHVDEIAKFLGVKPKVFIDAAGSCPHCDGTGYALLGTSGKRDE